MNKTDKYSITKGGACKTVNCNIKIFQTAKQPEIFGEGKLKQVLKECSTVLTDTYYPTPWCLGPHLHTLSRVLVQHVPKLILER